MNNFKWIGIVIFLLLISENVLNSQTDLLNMLDSISPKETQYTYGTFKSTRVVNGQSIERMPEKQLDFRVSHRFGLVSQGYYQFFGLDEGNMFLSLEYGIKDWIMVGLNRASTEKTVSGFTKFSIIRQSTGVINMPISLSYFASASMNGLTFINPVQNNDFYSRLTYTHQLLIARKFNEHFSLQISPTLIHRNIVPTVFEKNDLYAIGFSGRYKITRRIAFNVEYYPVYRPPLSNPNQYENSFAIGFDIETGGHVFQILVSNSVGMIEKAFIGETTDSWMKGNLHLGFNISRVFSFKKGKF